MAFVAFVGDSQAVSPVRSLCDGCEAEVTRYCAATSYFIHPSSLFGAKVYFTVFLQMWNYSFISPKTGHRQYSYRQKMHQHLHKLSLT